MTLMIAPDLLDNLVAQFYADGLVVIEQALPASLTHALWQEAQSSQLQAASVGRGSSQLLDQQIRRDQTRWFDGSSHAQKEYMQLLDQVQQAVNRRCFLGLTHYECHFARYGQGDYYQKHLDAFQGRSNRRLTTVVYLNDVDSGGQLRIYDDKDQWLCDVTPKAGTLVMFESERFPHEVLVANDERFSIAGWFRVDSAVL